MKSSRVATIVHYASGITRDCVTWVWIDSGELPSMLRWLVFMEEGESIV